MKNLIFILFVFSLLNNLSIKAQTCTGTRTFTAPTGTFDDGSGSAIYSDNLACYTVISVPNATSITFSFPSIQIENGYDYLYLFQGAYPNYILQIEKLTGGDGGPRLKTWTVAGNSVTLLFKSDESVGLQGWTCSYTSISGFTGVNGIATTPGQVAIGTTTANPNYLLTVNGGIVCNRVHVCNDPPQCDYVFNPNYILPKLLDVENYIKENKHLPGVQSADEFKANGYNVDEMDNIFLKKIEELTLYMIELKKENEELKNEVKKLQK